jgi:hypothetical protein
LRKLTVRRIESAKILHSRTAHEVIHGRFALSCGFDRAVEKERAYEARRYREGPALWHFRVQAGSLWAEFWLWRHLLWTLEDDEELRRDCAALRAKWGAYNGL